MLKVLVAVHVSLAEIFTVSPRHLILPKQQPHFDMQVKAILVIFDRIIRFLVKFQRNSRYLFTFYYDFD